MAVKKEFAKLTTLREMYDIGKTKMYQYVNEMRQSPVYRDDVHVKKQMIWVKVEAFERYWKEQVQ